jgi:hypothetical protein
VPFEAGTFAVNSRTPDAFSERDRQFLAKMAVALQERFRRMSDLQEVQERSREAEQLTAKLQAALDREVVLSRIRDQIMEMRTLCDAPQHRDMLAALRELGVPVDGMSMQFPASKPNHYETFHASSDVSSADVAMSHLLDDHPWVRQVWQTGKPVVVNADQIRRAGVDDWELWQIVEVPLPGGGSLGVNRQDGGAFTDDMIETVEAFAGVVAAGVQRPASAGFRSSRTKRGALSIHAGKSASRRGTLDGGWQNSLFECHGKPDVWL